MVRSSAVSPLVPRRTPLEALPSQVDGPPCSRSGLTVAEASHNRADQCGEDSPPSMDDATAAPELATHFDQPAHPAHTTETGASTSEDAQANPGTLAAKPRSGPKVKFTLDVPLDLHRAMKLQTIRRRTTIVATVRQILSNYYGVTADISPGERKLAAGEPTKRLTLDLDPDLHTEMMLQKVLRGANIQAEVLYLTTCHYLPGE